MSPKLKPSLSPLPVQQRQLADAPSSYMASPDHKAMSCTCYTTTNSSSSDIASPGASVFSPRSHQRYSSSTSSLELPVTTPSECPSPTRDSFPSTASSVQQHLADVEEEEPPQLVGSSSIATPSSDVGDRRCTHNHHSSSTEAICPGDHVGFDLDMYDTGFLSDGDVKTGSPASRKTRSATESAFSDITSKLSSRMPTIRRWRSTKRVPPPISTPNTCPSLEKARSHRGQGSRSSSKSPSCHRFPAEAAVPAVPSLHASMSFRSLDDSPQTGLGIDMTPEDHSHLERDRATATTPLLPPLLSSAPDSPPRESPLQSPKVESSPTLPDTPLTPSLCAPPQFGRPPLSARPSTSSLRKMASNHEHVGALPVILQEHDEWSDRLGHANFTISPEPYGLDSFDDKAIAQFCEDRKAARSNYTKHLVRTGENYGQTSKIYALTEAKWAEIERRWNATVNEVMKHTGSPAPVSGAASRAQSRGRGRGRSSSSNAAATARLVSQDSRGADVEWRRLEDCLPGAVPQMVESLTAGGKFPGRGDEDIVGPMQRHATMTRARSEDARSRFWRNLVDRVSLRKS